MADLILPKVFTSPTHGQLVWDEVLAKIVWFMSLDSLASYDVIIGTDSEAQNGSSDFVSAIIVHKKGRGGVYFWGRQKIAHLNSMKQRIWQEATLSLTLAQRLVDDFAKGVYQSDPRTTGLGRGISKSCLVYESR